MKFIKVICVIIIMLCVYAIPSCNCIYAATKLNDITLIINALFVGIILFINSVIWINKFIKWFDSKLK